MGEGILRRREPAGELGATENEFDILSLSLYLAPDRVLSRQRRRSGRRNTVHSFFFFFWNTFSAHEQRVQKRIHE